MNKKLLIGIVVVLVVAVGIGIYFLVNQRTNQQANEPSEIVIGYNADQSTGATAAFGVLGREGVEIAVDEINAKGGVLGKKIKLVVLDDKSNQEISLKNMEQLVSQDKALAVIGPANSANALYWLEFAQDNEVIVISPIATASEITTRYEDRPRNYIFGIRVLDKEQARLFIAWAIKKTNNGKIAIIYDSTSYGMQGVKDVNEVLARWGKTPVLAKAFDRGTSVENLTKIIESAKTAGADAIVFYCLTDSSADLLKALGQVKNYNPIVVGTASNALGLWQLAGPLASKLVFTSPVTAEFNERTRELNQKIIDRYGTTPAVLSSAASGYDAVYFLKAAIEKVGKADRVAVRDAMENIESFQGTMRVFKRPFTKQNHEFLTVTDSFLSHWVDGKVVLLDEDISNLEIK